jgi:hypothetical protein
MTRTIYKNLPEHPEWEGSFYEKLAEYGIWDADEFWKLHFDLVQAAKKNNDSESINRKFALIVVTLYSKINNLISSHYNKNDVFQISNLTPDELLAFKERLDHSIIGVFSGEVIAESLYDLTNPNISVT